MPRGIPTPNNPVNVLCLDGGGVRGLSSLLILRNLFQRLSNQYSPPDPLLPCDIFDIICGTSTGGIIALLLGRLHMSVDEAIEAYLDFSKTVFEKKETPDPIYNASKFEEWMEKIVASEYFSKPVFEEKKATDNFVYDASKFQKWMKRIIYKKTGDRHTPLLEESRRCRTFVAAVNNHYIDSPPKLFRTYTAYGMPGDDCKIWEAARATIATIPFFAPASFGTPRSTYADGWFSGFNNTSRLAIIEVEDIFPSHKIGCLLSLGTGISDFLFPRKDERKILDACVKIGISCERVHEETYRDFRRNGRGKGYIRLSVDRGLGSIQLDEWKRSEDSTGITEGYLNFGEVEERMTKCIKILKEKSDMVVEEKIT